MKAALALTAAALLAACAAAPSMVPEDRPATGTEAAWRAGQTAHLAWNATRRGWSVSDSGLQHRRLSRARPDGARPGPADTVRVHYEGTFIDGRVFDSSYERGQPIEFPLDRVIAGWTEGVGLMREGETWEFLIPADLAYGDRWREPIPPGSALRFKVELLEVTPAG